MSKIHLKTAFHSKACHHHSIHRHFFDSVTRSATVNKSTNLGSPAQVRIGVFRALCVSYPRSYYLSGKATLVDAGMIVSCDLDLDPMSDLHAHTWRSYSRDLPACQIYCHASFAGRIKFLCPYRLSKVTAFWLV